MKHIVKLRKMGININSRKQDFIGLILDGWKDVETRRSPSLRPYLGKRVGLIRTGCGKATLVGYATVKEEIFYDTIEAFRADYYRHLVTEGSQYDITEGKGKYGYVLTDVVACKPRTITTKGIVARRI